VAVVPSTRIYEGTRIPQRVPTILDVDTRRHDPEDILRVNFGPNHPSTHGVLRLIVDLDGEAIAGLEAVIGYLHTGFEKTMEQKSWWKSVTYPARIDYLGFHANELEYVLAIEKLLGIEVPRRATWARMCLAELNRIHSHLVWLGTSALEVGAISMFWYAFDDRDAVLDLFELAGGTRLHTRYVQAGGLAEDLPPVLADPFQLEQVFLNICLNACQAMDQAGTLTVRSRPGEGTVVVEIEDTGPGIPADVRAQIFKPFFTTKRQGNGLGLAISARIIAEHGGHIGYRCPPEGGTTFTVTLKQARSTRATEHAA